MAKDLHLKMSVEERLENIGELLIEYLHTEYGMDEVLEEKIRKFFKENGHAFRMVRGW